jgi:hypothetical protein
MNDAALLDATELGRFYLGRLERFARLVNGLASAVLPQMRRLAGHATLAAYRDCVALGLEREAREILAHTAKHPAVFGPDAPSVWTPPDRPTPP